MCSGTRLAHAPGCYISDIHLPTLIIAGFISEVYNLIFSKLSEYVVLGM